MDSKPRLLITTAFSPNKLILTKCNYTQNNANILHRPSKEGRRGRRGREDGSERERGIGGREEGRGEGGRGERRGGGGGGMVRGCGWH